MEVPNRNILIVGEAGSGKSTSLQNLRERAAMAYLNCDGKALPIRGRNAFLCNEMITEPMDVLDMYDQLEGAETCQGVILDTLTFLMAQYARKIIPTFTNGKQGWGQYFFYYQELVEKIKTSKKVHILMAHTDTELDEQKGHNVSKVLLQGQVGKRGVDADFGIIVTAKQIPLRKLKGFDNPMLTITEEEEAMGVKYVFQTRPSKEGVGERTRSPIGMWSANETFIDNNVQYVLDRIEEYYAAEED